MKKEVNVFEYASEIMSALKKGILITTASGEKINSMSIAWGMLGTEWEKPIFIAFVREGRFTRTLLDESMNFTVNIPQGEYDKKIIGFCGTKSGRDIDKIKKLGLTLVASDCITSPAIKELPLTLECKVLYKQLQDKSALPKDILESLYPENIGSENPFENSDTHIAYYGEIVKAYLIE